MIRADTSHPTIAILADDLTSAADCGAPFQRYGLRVRVMRGTIDPAESASDVWAVDCASRSLSIAEAADISGQFAGVLAKAPVLIKTVDSTLRGHLRAEIEAAFRASARRRIVIAPAFPEAGRTTRKAVQYVNDVPVCLSPYADDPVHPARTSRIADLLPELGLGTMILDAETQDELNQKVALIEGAESALWVGSPGLANALAKRFGQERSDQTEAAICSSILVAVGSANPISRAQLVRVAAHPNVTCLGTPEERHVSPTKALSDLVERAARRVDDCEALIATGGDTMDALLSKLGIRHFSLQGEFEPGFPWGVATLPQGRRLTLGMKAGGFGDKDTLLRAIETLSGGQGKVC